MTIGKTVLLCGKEDILISSVKSLLDTNDNLKVIRVSSTADIGAIFTAVKETQADTIIIHQGDRNKTNILTLRLIREHPGLRVITINLENNEMEVFSKKEIVLKATSDLISVIEDASL